MNRVIFMVKDMKNIQLYFQEFSWNIMTHQIKVSTFSNKLTDLSGVNIL